MRALCKTLANTAALVLIAPFLLSFWLRAMVLGRDRALEGSSEWLSLLPGLPGRYLRRAFLGSVLKRCHPSAVVGFGSLFSKADARIDENVYIGPRCHLGLVHLERDVLLAAGVHVTSGARLHGIDDPDRPIREQAGVATLVRIGAGSWIGSGAVIMADVGRDTVVGAGAVVTKPLPDRVIAVGVPARVVRSRNAGSTLEPGPKAEAEKQ